MLKLIKLYSDDRCFRDIKFHDGVNLICGEKSIDKQGNVASNKQNGVGKSLLIELINFCFLKSNVQSKIPLINDEYLPGSSYANLHFKYNDNDYIISRNKEDRVKIKEGNNDFVELNYDDAKSYLSNILDFNKKPISLREYFNFTVKEEDYSYKEFGVFYRSNYVDLLKIHFYFFNLPVDYLKAVGQLFEKRKMAQKQLRAIKRSLKNRDLDITKLRAIKNDLESQIQLAEDSLEYKDVIKNIDRAYIQINKTEKEINKLLLRKKRFEMELMEITDFHQFFSEDFYIDDKDIQIVFNKFNQGLGDYIKKDIKSLRLFRDQIMSFKGELLKEKRDVLLKAIKDLSDIIDEKQEEMTKHDGDVLKTKSNNLIKNLRIYKKKYSELEDFSIEISIYEKQEKILDQVKSMFDDYYKKINQAVFDRQKEIASVKQTFLEIHKFIMGSSECDFDISVTNSFAPTSFFQIRVYVEGQGSKGVNQMQSVMYDFALLSNEFTSRRHLKILIHDNLIFGSVDKDSSIKALNYINKIDASSFQYIATVNKDDFDYKELQDSFKFDREKAVVIELTKENPLFPKWKKT